MKKKILPLVLAVVFVILLAGCKSQEVKTVEEMIATIGYVTLDSISKIESAENAYNQLPDNEKRNVGNISILYDARRTYDTLKKEDDERKAEEERLKPITLTLSNYSDYLNIAISTEGASPQRDYAGNTYYLGIKANYEIEGASPNFSYNDVSITFRITGGYSSYFDDGIGDIDDKYTVKCNVGGHAKESHYIVSNSVFLTNSYIFGYEVTAVSGEVTPIK